MPHILTVDDSSTIRSIINKTLGDLGFLIEQAEDGEQGLAKLREVSVDLILLDVTMPVMDGPTMLEKLRASGNRTPVIMLTSESKRSIMTGAIKLGGGGGGRGPGGPGGRGAGGRGGRRGGAGAAAAAGGGDRRGAAARV